MSYTPDRPRPRDPRHDGWTVARQQVFLDALMKHGNVARAASEVGLSASSAYRLRHRDADGAFGRGWESAAGMAYDRLRELAIDRIERGVAKADYYRGNCVGSTITYSDRLLMMMLNHLKPVAPPVAPRAPAVAAYAAVVDAYETALEDDLPPAVPVAAIPTPPVPPAPGDDAPAYPSEGFPDTTETLRGARACALLAEGRDPYPVRFPGRIYPPHPDECWLEAYPDGLDADDLAREDECHLALVGLTKTGAATTGAAGGEARGAPARDAAGSERENTVVGVNLF